MFTVTKEMVDDFIVKRLDYKLGEKTTVVLLQLKNGFEVIGQSGCIDPANYVHEIGVKYATERAESKVWTLLGFLMQEERMRQQTSVHNA